MTKDSRCIWTAMACVLAISICSAICTGLATAQTTGSDGGATPFHAAGGHLPLEMGVLVQSGFGVTESRGSFKFLLVGVHAGKVLTGKYGPGPIRGNFEYAVEVFPLWQSYSPKFERRMCIPGSGGVGVSCSAPYTVGGTFTGVSITPILLRWNLVGTRRISPWLQGGGGMIWTNHKYPAFGGPPYNLSSDGANSDTSIWNFTPQFGVGAHYFISPRRSVDFGANAIHISSSSLGDKNPGINASVQFSVGYTWWR